MCVVMSESTFQLCLSLSDHSRTVRCSPGMDTGAQHNGPKTSMDTPRLCPIRGGPAQSDTLSLALDLPQGQATLCIVSIWCSEVGNHSLVSADFSED